MNVLFLDQFGQLGGAQRCLLDLLPAVAGAGWKAHVAAPGDGELLARALGCGAAAHPIVCGSYSAGRKSLQDVARFAARVPRLAGTISGLARDCGADLIYVNGPRMLPAAALATHGGVPVLFHAHLLLDGYVRRLAGESLRLARALVVACCGFVADPLRTFCGERGVQVVYNGVAANRLRLREGSGFRIGMIGRIAPEKGQTDFLRAAHILLQDLPQSRFLICGAPLFSNAETSHYAVEVERLAAGIPVDFTGWCDDLDAVLPSLDLLVVPSSPIDASPRVILEAFGAGVPVMAYDGGGIPELIEHGVTGFLVREHSPEALAAEIGRVLAEPQRLRAIAARAHERVRMDFSLERYREQMIQAMRAAAGS